MIKKILGTIVGLILVTLLGCSALLDVITPCFISPDAIDYAGTEPKTFMPFTSLWDSERIVRLVDWEWQKKQLKYGFIKKISQLHQASARELQSQVMIPMMVSLTGVGAFGLGWLGVKRPKDKTQKEYETAGKMNPRDFVA